MKCGQEVQVVDWNGSVAATAVSQCGGGFLVINHNPAWNTHDAPFRNGERLWGWQPLLERLVWLIVHPGGPERAFSYVARTGGDTYVQVQLLPQVKASELAKLLDAPLDEVRVQVHDWIVVLEPEEASGGD